MPKVGKDKKLNRVARRVAAANPLPTSEKEKIYVEEDTTTTNSREDVTKGGETLSRGQRKRLAKHENYRKKEKMILATLMLKKRDEQKKRIDGLDAIREALIDTTKTPAPNDDETDEYNPSYGSNRARKGLISSEIERMSLVQQHPAFKLDPFATLQEHLTNTFAEQKEKLQKEAREKAENDKKKKEEKKQEKKERLQGVKKNNNKKYKTRRSK